MNNESLLSQQKDQFYFQNQQQCQSPQRLKINHEDSLSKTPLSKKSTPHVVSKTQKLEFTSGGHSTQNPSGEKISMKLDFANLEQLQISDNKIELHDSNFIQQQHNLYYDYPERRRTIAGYNCAPENFPYKKNDFQQQSKF